VDDTVAQSGHPSIVPPPLDVVGVEQRVAGLIGHDRGQLPAQIRGVADPAVVALALPHRHQVCGVARQHQTTLPERPGDPRMVGVDPMPNHVDTLGMWHS
jgi:hypothetical protein